MSDHISLICALSQNHAIGLHNDLPWHIPQDLEHFKTLTKGKPIIMGRLTYESILARRSGKPLPGRPHYVISTRAISPLPESVHSCTSLDDAILQAKSEYPDSEIMIIGGASVYKQAIRMVTTMYLTVIEAEIAGDAFFPEYTQSDWIESSNIPQDDGNCRFRFITLKRR
jgi:dihydrofolate reductase